MITVIVHHSCAITFSSVVVSEKRRKINLSLKFFNVLAEKDIVVVFTKPNRQQISSKVASVTHKATNSMLIWTLNYAPWSRCSPCYVAHLARVGHFLSLAIVFINFFFHLMFVCVDWPRKQAGEQAFDLNFEVKRLSQGGNKLKDVILPHKSLHQNVYL